VHLLARKGLKESKSHVRGSIIGIEKFVHRHRNFARILWIRCRKSCGVSPSWDFGPSSGDFIRFHLSSSKKNAMASHISLTLGGFSGSRCASFLAIGLVLFATHLLFVDSCLAAEISGDVDVCPQVRCKALRSPEAEEKKMPFRGGLVAFKGILGPAGSKIPFLLVNFFLAWCT
jgi:hypothetical protein